MWRNTCPLAVLVMLSIFIQGPVHGYDPGFHPEDNTVGTSDWLVILYMAGDNDLGRDNVEWGNPLKMDLKELELSMPNDGATVLALADFDGPHNTYLYNISKNLTREIGSQTIPLSDVDPSWVDEVDMSDPETLRKFLVYSMGNYSALNTMFVLWDHGSGWYFNSLSPGSRSSDPDTRGFAQDSNSGGVMYLDEFRDAFIEAGKELGELSMDIVGFDTCSMGMMEVYYQVSPWFDLAIGSEDEQPYYGYNYSFISGMGGSNPLDPVELGKDVIDRFSNEYNTPGGYLYGSICLVDLKKMKDSFIPAMDSMLLPVMERMYQNENLSDHLFHSIVGKTEPITYTEPDLGDLLIKLADSDLQDDITISAGALLIKYDEMVLDEWHKSDGRNPGATGISIYLPKWNPTSPIIHPMYHGYTGFLNFTMDTLWDEMLIEYHHPIQRVLVTLNLSAMDGDLLKDDLVISADNPQVGLPISSGKVYLNGEYSADTDGEGQVLMKNMGPGMYHVEVFNGTHVGQASIRVLNRPPVPVVNPASPIVHEGEHFFLDASMSSDPDDDKMTFVWDLDLSNGENDTDSTLHRVNLVYFESGTHSVKLIVSDGELNSSVIISIQVLNMPPNPRLVIPMDVPEDSYFDIDASGSWDIGPDDDTLMFMYLVDDEPIGGWTNRSSTSYSLSRSGEYEVKVVVRDQDGDENTTSGMLTVRNVIPIANFTGPVELREGQIGTFDASLSTDSSSDIGGLNYTWYTQLGPDPIGYGKQLELVCYTEEDLALQLMVTDDDGDIGSCSRIVNIKNRPPITIISGPSEIMEDEIVLLNGSASSDSPWDLDGLVYLWDIGEDGEVDSYERTLEVSFPDEGQKVITLTVIDSDGGSSSAVHHLAVNNRAPTPVIIGPSFANEDEQVLFKLGDDPDSISDIPSLAISWFLDSEKVGEGTYLNRTFTTEGEHTIEVRVNDDQDALGTFDLTLTVHNPRPSVEIKGVPTSVGPGDEITAQGHRSTDTPSDRGSLEFRWFLDGELLPDGSRNITFGVEEEGEHELMLRVEDDEGASNEISVTFTVERPPVLERIIGFLSSLTGFLLMVGLLVIILLSAYQMTKKLKELPPPERMPVENEDDAAPEKVEPDGTEDAGEDDTQEEVPDPVVEPEMEETDVPLPDMGEVEMGEPPEPPGELEIPDVDESIFDR